MSGHDCLDPAVQSCGTVPDFAGLDESEVTFQTVEPILVLHNVQIAEQDA